MTKKYKQLTPQQRYKIEALISVNLKQTDIADIIGVHKSTISRELNRNVPKRGIGANVYCAENAQKKTRQRHQTKNKFIRFTPSLKKQLKEWMDKKRFSPELVAAQWIKDGVKGVSHETIYKFIWHCKKSNKRINKEYKTLYKYLKHGRRKRKRGNYKDSRGLITNRVSIEKRPKIVEKRERFGDFEGDLVMGRNHKSALIVTIDRSILKITINKITSKDPKKLATIISRRLKKMPYLKTITFDNDQAFAMHEIVAKKLNIKIYFTRPYTSQDKGTIENRNGIIRMFFPKKTDFNKISHQKIKRVENAINNRPVRKFGYLTPNELFSRIKGRVALVT
jgi:IS30 family transposase